MTRVLLLYHDTAGDRARLRRLAARDGCEVVTLTLDLGQPVNPAESRARALATGAVRAHVIDAREALAERMALPALRAGAVCLRDDDPLVGPLASPIIARYAAEVAAMEQAGAIAHGGASGRLSRLLETLTKTRLVAAPDGAAGGADGPLAGVSAGDDAPGGCSTLWGRAEPVAERGGDPAAAARPAASGSAVVEIAVSQGAPVAVNGVAMPFVELVASLDTIAGSHGVGTVGREGRTGTVERWRAPAALLLSRAVRALEASCLPPALVELRRVLADAYVDLLYEGAWYSPTREAIDAFTGRALALVDGSVRFELLNAEARVLEVA